MTDPSFPQTIIDGAPVVATPAEIDITTSERLRAALLHAAGKGHPVIVVDMTGTSFCDSSGIQALAAAHTRARSGGGEVRLVLPAGGTVPRVLALSGMDRFIPCFAHLDQALARPPYQPGAQSGGACLTAGQQ